MRSFWWLMLLALPFVSIRPAAGLVSLQARPVTAAATGDEADLCIFLDSGGAQVVGTQNDLRWDGMCATLASRADCHVNPAIGESLFGAISTDFTYRGLVLSLSEVKRIPDGELYCCTFRVEAPPGSCCTIQVVNTAAADTRALPLVTVGNTAQLCATASDAGLAPTSTPTSTPTLHGDPLGHSDSNGCQIAPARAPGCGFALFAVALLWALRRRRQHAA